MYARSAQFYDALYHFKDYAAATTQLRSLVERYHPTARSLLDVGCGTGLHLVHLRQHFEVEGLDVSPEMLAVARERCADIPLHEHSMVDFQLDHRFDVIGCLFSSIAYVKTAANMRQAVATMAKHLQPGGLLIVEPWFSPESYWVGRVTANFVDQPDLKIAWMYISEREGLLT
ncbi:MAG: class I SAM-dependent DNA methyltransferase, partial [Oscillochloridaceae bacterium umkhey_bin13]